MNNQSAKINNQLRGVLLFFFVLFIFARCANESVPQGGAQDTTPPAVKKSSPPNKTTGFKTDKITITFNEFLKETGFAQTLISPPTEKRPVIHVAGKTLTVKLKSPLRDSTTYTINFADDVQDLNEGNEAPNFTYVFSTGNYIDSQNISGSVLLAKDNSAQENIVVALYPQDSLDGILKSKPFYFAKTDKSGNFKIENIKAGKYWAYALKDQNYNYIYDQPNELIAFSDTVIDLKDTLPKNVSLVLFEENKNKIRLDEVRTIAPGKIQISYNKPISQFKLDAALYSTSDFAYVYPTKDTIIYWYSKYYQRYDTLYLAANDTILDTMRMELKSIEKDSLTTGNKYFLSIENQSDRGGAKGENKQLLNVSELYKPLKINLSSPILEINQSKRLRISQDSSTNSFEPDFLLDEKTKQFISIDFKKQEKTNYKLEIPDSTFRDIFGLWNRKLTYNFTTNTKDSYGNLKITLKTEHPEKYYVIRLLNANNVVEKEFYFTGNGERKITVENILAGGYKFVVIDDENKNGEWDSGDFKRKIQPEKIFTYKDVYQLKGGWDLEAEVRF